MRGQHRPFMQESHSYLHPELREYRDVLGQGIVVSEGARWKHQRTLLSPAFHFAALERLMPVFEAASARLSCVMAGFQ